MITDTRILQILKTSVPTFKNGSLHYIRIPYNLEVCTALRPEIQNLLDVDDDIYQTLTKPSIFGSNDHALIEACLTWWFTENGDRKDFVLSLMGFRVCLP